MSFPTPLIYLLQEKASPKEKADMLRSMSAEDKGKMLAAMSPQERAKLLESMSDAERADVMSLMSAKDKVHCCVMNCCQLAYAMK